MGNDAEISREIGSRDAVAARSGGERVGIVEVKVGLRAIRNLRASLLSLTHRLARETGVQGYLVLVDPKISETRLQAEWEATRDVLKKGVGTRLNILVLKDERFTGLPHCPTEQVERYVTELVAADGALVLAHGTPAPADRAARTGLQRPDYFFVVLKVLVRHWLLGKGPVTTRRLMESAGCTYPTVAAALKRLGVGRVVTRHSDRKIELDRFPHDAWAQLLAVSDRVRATARYADRSGRPRSPEALLRRLRGLGQGVARDEEEERDKAVNRIAVGGAAGAKHWYPDLDLHGSPRLDLSVHCPDKWLDLGFVRELDPALARVEDPLEPATLVVHAVRRARPMFEPGRGGTNWADPVECLLDLHEMRLDRQAQEFLKRVAASNRNHKD